VRKAGSIIDDLWYADGDNRVVWVRLEDTGDGSGHTYSWRREVTVKMFGDDERSELQRLDDLIVSLYWLIYRNTRQNELNY
jgi:hypothetical protein